MLRGVASLVCMRRPKLDCDNNTVHPLENTNQNNGGQDKKKMQVTDVEQVEDNTLLQSVNAGGSGSQLWPQDVLKFIRKKMQDDIDNDKFEQNKEEWEHLARVLDRLLLIVSGILITVIFIGFIAAICFDYEA